MIEFLKYFEKKIKKGNKNTSLIEAWTDLQHYNYLKKLQNNEIQLVFLNKKIIGV